MSKTFITIRDINGKIIKIGDTVKTTQPSGGVLPPGDPVIGIVEVYPDGDLVIRYRKEGQSFDRFIRLEGKINEIIKQVKTKEYHKIHYNENAAKDHRQRIENRGGKVIYRKLYSESKGNHYYDLTYTFKEEIQ